MPEVKHQLEIKFGTTYGNEEAEALLRCLKDNAPSCGKKVKEFETAFAVYCGATYALAVTSATTGLTLAGIAAGIGLGDEVITTPLSWISTASAFSALGAEIVFCDVDPKTLCLSADCLEALITPKTKAIIPVHLYGQCAEMDRIMAIAKRHNVLVIDDCAHNPGGSYQNKKTGTLADISVFSFHQQKNMSTLGEGGMVTTNNHKLFERVLSYRSLCCRAYGPSDKYLSIDETLHPMDKKYWHLEFDDIGFNFRMTDAQACVGLEQLKKLDGNNARRTELGRRLTEYLKDIPYLIPPHEDPNGQHVYHIYMLQLTPNSPVDKESFMYRLYYEKGVKAWSHYLPIHLTAPFRSRGHKEGECPVCEAVFRSFVTLPIFPHMTEEALRYMADSVRELLLETK